MFTNRIVLTLIALASLPAFAVAHPGHGNSRDGNSLLHYVTSPLHVIPVLVAAILLTGLSLFARRVRFTITYLPGFKA